MNKTLTVIEVERLKNSVNGNPRYKVYALQGEFVTQSDNSHVYGFEYHKLGRGDVINVELSQAGRITHATLLNKKA